MSNEPNFENETPQGEPIQQPAPEPSAQPEPTAQPAPATRPSRRVGTLTMGFALIATGVIALISTFMPRFDLVNVFKLSPIIFVFLGVEILISYFFNRGEKIKYDFFSGFVCFLLICGGVGLSALPTVWNYWGPPAQQALNQLRDSVEDELYEQLKNTARISSVSVNTDFPYYIDYNTDVSLETLTEQSSIYLYIRLTGSYTDEQQFAKDSQRVLERINSLPYRFRHIEFSYNDDRVSLNLNVGDKFQFNMDAAGLAGLTNVSFHDSDERAYRDTPSREDSTESAVEVPASSVEASSAEASSDGASAVEALAADSTVGTAAASAAA